MKRGECVKAAIITILFLVPASLHAGELLRGLEKDIAQIIARSRPFVVRITTEAELPGLDMMNGFEGLFPSGRRSGSGFIVEPDGYILTTENVIRGGGRIVVTLHDERQREARLVGKDGDVDVALLKIEGGNLKKARIGDSDKTEPGSWAICIGHPFGLTETATLGIVSGKGRSGLGICAYENFLQLDASINPGDCGGPVINSRGEVIGIMAAALSNDWPFGPRALRGPGDAFSMNRTRSISFAIPINMAMNTFSRLKEKKAVERAWLGVHVMPVTPEQAATAGLSSVSGAIVVKVIEGSPADRAGIEQGDAIVSYGGKKLCRACDLPFLLSRSPVGEPVGIEIIRDGAGITVEPVLEKYPEVKGE